MKLRYSARSLKQIDSVLRYVSAQSPRGAANVESRLRAVLAMVEAYPPAGVKTRLPSVRRVLVTPYPYLIDDLVGDTEIVGLRFRQTARKPNEGDRS